MYIVSELHYNVERIRYVLCCIIAQSARIQAGFDPNEMFSFVKIPHVKHLRYYEVFCFTIYLHSLFYIHY